MYHVVQCDNVVVLQAILNQVVEWKTPHVLKTEQCAIGVHTSRDRLTKLVEDIGVQQYAEVI